MRGKHREGGRTCSPRRRSLHSDEPLRRNGRKTPAAKSIFIERPTCSAREKRPSGWGVRFCTRGMGWGGELSDFLPFQLSLDSLCCARATGTYTNHSPTLVRVEHDPLQVGEEVVLLPTCHKGAWGELQSRGRWWDTGQLAPRNPPHRVPFRCGEQGKSGKGGECRAPFSSPGERFEPR